MDWLDTHHLAVGRGRPQGYSTVKLAVPGEHGQISVLLLRLESPSMRRGAIRLVPPPLLRRLPESQSCFFVRGSFVLFRVDGPVSRLLVTSGSEPPSTCWSLFGSASQSSAFESSFERFSGR